MMCVSVNLRISQLCAKLYLYCDTYKLFRFFSLATQNETDGVFCCYKWAKKVSCFFLLVTFSEKK